MLVDWDEMKQLYRGPYIDALCQVWFHLAQLFQRSTLKYEKVNGRTPSDGNTTHDPLGWVMCANKKGCNRLAAESDKAYQLVAHGRWFSSASSTTKTGRRDIAEILLKVVLKHQKSKSCYTILAFYFE